MYTLASVSVGVAAAQFWRSIGKAAGGTPEWFSHWIIGFLAGVGGFLMAFALLWERWQDQQRIKEAGEALRDAEAALKGDEALSLPSLWDVTHKRLDLYHEIATTQARKSFRNAQLAMVGGFLLLTAFAYLALRAPTTSASIVTGALGAAAAAFGAYIGRTFVRSQETAASHLRAYFNQPLEFSRYLAAERFLGAMKDLPAERQASLASDMLRAMVQPAVSQEPTAAAETEPTPTAKETP
ncbi:TRADD-N-associated membrane domain-containing protein [Nonomuraea dietziae]|uniref:TRADD-N-associated membrane domain-containing protein n=1 Tax=Nonomuraea dietziae TaxID=65515 RepID=UPI003439F822